jgi:hypothetical protein
LPKGTCFPIRGKLISQKENCPSFLALFSMRKIDAQLGVNLCARGVTYLAEWLHPISIIS